MYTKDKILALLRKNKKDLFARYPISELGLFGSFARGDFNEQSDIDILVDFDGKIDGYAYIRLAHEFEDLFQHKIDMLSRKAIKPGYLQLVERNLIHVWT